MESNSAAVKQNKRINKQTVIVGLGKKFRRLFLSDPLLWCSLLLAVGSAFVVPPNAAYLHYLDLRTLAMLFSLMLVVAGFKQTGVFAWLAGKLLAFAHTTRSLSAVMIGVCFFCSMLITNDIALLTFVPFTIMLLAETGNSRLMIPLIVLQTISANLGSSLTPLGNPQNLYIYSLSGMSPGSFLQTMALPVGISLLLLAVSLLFIKNQPLHTKSCGQVCIDKKQVLLWVGLFGLCLLAVLRLIHYALAFGIIVAAVLCCHRPMFAKVDYSLLLTFVFLFIFTGNLGNLPEVSRMAGSFLQGHEFAAGVLLSQFISNVPAAMLLSGFTDNYPSLLLGVNIGGLGTLIASMASLISYKMYSHCSGASHSRYLLIFTVLNLLFLVILCLFVYLSGVQVL